MPVRFALVNFICVVCSGFITFGSALLMKPEPNKKGRMAHPTPTKREPISTTPPQDDKIREMWERFTKEQELSAPHESHFEAFQANVLSMHKLNDEHGVPCTDLFEGSDCIFGVTKFSHLTEKEFAATRLGYKRKTSKNATKVISAKMLASLNTADEVVDWRSKGAVTPVKDQYECGSCWAFSAVSEVESAVFLATGELQELSTQQVISCDTDAWGCEGGDTTSAYEYVMQAGGLTLAAKYPDESHITGESGFCQDSSKKVASISSYEYAVEPCDFGMCDNQDEDGLATVVSSKGPVSVCVNAGDVGWQLYVGGVYNAMSCSGAADDLDHCIQLVGYNKAAEMPYWILRNSWNTDWGIEGYMYLSMGSNLCGIADEAQYVSVG